MVIGVLGGTFDPPHLGHLILAELARESLNLQRVLWVPAADPPHKSTEQVTHVSHRLSMVRLAIEDNTKFEVSLVDIQRPGPHYSVDMLAILAGENALVDMCFLIGGDSLNDLPTWHQPEKLLQHARLGVFRRTDSTPDTVVLEQHIPGLAEKIDFIETPLIEIASSDIRRKIQQGRSIRYQVPLAVEEYIYGNNLYR